MLDSFEVFFECCDDNELRIMSVLLRLHLSMICGIIYKSDEGEQKYIHCFYSAITKKKFKKKKINGPNSIFYVYAKFMFRLFFFFKKWPKIYWYKTHLHKSILKHILANICSGHFLYDLNSIKILFI